MDLLGIKTWLLGNAVMILGVALVLTVGYASWLQFITVPRLHDKVAIAEANELAAKANTQTAVAANTQWAETADRCSKSVQALAAQGTTTQALLKPILAQLGTIGKDVKAQLDAFTPDPKKSDCENAKAELNLFKIERAGR